MVKPDPDVQKPSNEFESLVEQFLLLLKSNRKASIEQFARMHPVHAERLRELLPTLVAMENLQDASGSGKSGNEALPSNYASDQLKQLGDYRVIREIGRGGMGIVYEAEQISLQRRVALKVLPHGCLDGQSAERFRREARAAAKLHHTNIIPVYDVGEQDGILFFAMQFIDGAGLDAVVKQLKVIRASMEPLAPDPEPSSAISIARQLSRSSVISKSNSSSELKKANHQHWSQISNVGIQAADALAFAHQQGVLHRDIKPGNLLLDESGTIWIMDFGLARTEESRNLTRSGDIVGTLRYLAPETLSGETDHRSDVYALGITLYELICLRPAFDASNRYELFQSIAESRPQKLSKILPDVPVDLETIIAKAIDPEPFRRYQRAHEFATDLRRFVSGEPILARRLSPLGRFKRWSSRNLTLAVSIITGFTLVLLLAVVSTVFAIRVAGLNSALNKTVDDLTSSRKATELARQQAQQTAVVNLKLADDVESARQESVSTLAKMYAARAWQVGQVGERAAAALWLAHAAQLTPFNPDLAATYQLAANNWLAAAPRPVAMIDCKRRGAKAYFQPKRKIEDSRESLVARLDGRVLSIWDWSIQKSLDWTRKGVKVVRWSPNGKRLAVAFASGIVEIINPLTGDSISKLELEPSVNSLCWSPDGGHLAVASKQLRLCKISPAITVAQQWRHPDQVFSLDFDDTGTLLVTSCKEGRARVYSVSPERSAQTNRSSEFEHQAAPFKAGARFIGDERTLVTLSRGRPFFWDVETGQEVTPGFEAKKDEDYLDLAISADGNWLAAGGRVSAMLWRADGTSYELSHRHNVTRVEFSPDNSILMTVCSDGFARAWRLPSKTPSNDSPRILYRIPAPFLAKLELSSDGRHFLICDGSRTTIWRTPDENIIRRSTHSENLRVRPRASLDHTLATFGRILGRPGSLPETRTLTVRKIGDGRPAGPEIMLEGALIDSCLCNDNRTVAVATAEGKKGKIRLFDSIDGQPLSESYMLPSPPMVINSRPDKPHFAALCRDGTLLVVDFGENRTVVQSRLDAAGKEILNMASISYSPDGKKLVAIPFGDRIYVCDADSGKEIFEPIRSVTSQTGMCRAIAFSSDSKLLAAAVTGKNYAGVWDLGNGERVGENMPHPGSYYGVSSVRFSPDSKLLITGHGDGLLRMWDWKQGELASSPIDHLRSLRGGWFTPDGQHAVAVDQTGAVYVRDIHNSQLVAPPHELTSGQPSRQVFDLVGTRLIASANDQFCSVDLAPLMFAPKYPIKVIQQMAELASGNRMRKGEVGTLLEAEWQQLWSNTAHIIRGFDR